MAYNDRSREELKPLVERYLEHFQARTGERPHIPDLIERVKALAHQKEQQAFHSTFGTLTPGDLQTTAKILQDIASEAAKMADQPAPDRTPVELINNQLADKPGKRGRKPKGAEYKGADIIVTEE